MKTYKYKLLFAALVHFVFVACKKDLTPTKSELKIGSINYSLIGQNSPSHYSNYSFEYSENNILKKVNLIGFLAPNVGFGNGPFNFTTRYIGNIFELDKNSGQSEVNNFNGEDQQIVIDNSGKISESILRDGFLDPTFGHLIINYPSKFVYLNGKLNLISESSYDSINDFLYDFNKLNSFTHHTFTNYIENILDSTIIYTLGYENTNPDTGVIKVNGINNLILCIPFGVQETLPFLVVDDRLSLTGKKQNYLINSISIDEKRGGVSQKTTNYTINYLYDLEGRITHVQWINNSTLAIYREAVIGYL